MSKEQLKKAKVLADMIRKETRLPHNFPYELIDWLIEQAEQNERYREALEKIKNKISKQLEGLDAEEEMQRVVELSELMTMTIEALEGEE